MLDVLEPFSCAMGQDTNEDFVGTGLQSQFFFNCGLIQTDLQKF